jgi:hypothetical protein
VKDVQDLLSRPPNVINVGLEIFYKDLKTQGVRAVSVEFRPPAGGDEHLAAILRRLQG